MNVPSSIPTSLEDVAEICGVRVAIALIDHFGGRELYIPNRFTPDHPLAKELGESDAASLIALLGGQRVTVPTQNIQRRHAAILRLRAEGKTMGTIARQLGLTERWVREIITRHDEQRQSSLFGN